MNAVDPTSWPPGIEVTVKAFSGKNNLECHVFDQATRSGTNFLLDTKSLIRCTNILGVISSPLKQAIDMLVNDR